MLACIPASWQEAAWIQQASTTSEEQVVLETVLPTPAGLAPGADLVPAERQSSYQQQLLDAARAMPNTMRRHLLLALCPQGCLLLPAPSAASGSAARGV